MDSLQSSLFTKVNLYLQTLPSSRITALCLLQILRDQILIRSSVTSPVQLTIGFILLQESEAAANLKIWGSGDDASVGSSCKYRQDLASWSATHLITQFCSFLVRNLCPRVGETCNEISYFFATYLLLCMSHSDFCLQQHAHSYPFSICSPNLSISHITWFIYYCFHYNSQHMSKISFLYLQGLEQCHVVHKNFSGDTL